MGKYYCKFIKNNYYTKMSITCILGTQYNSYNYTYNKMH